MFVCMCMSVCERLCVCVSCFYLRVLGLTPSHALFSSRACALWQLELQHTGDWGWFKARVKSLSYERSFLDGADQVDPPVTIPQKSEIYPQKIPTHPRNSPVGFGCSFVDAAYQNNDPHDEPIVELSSKSGSSLLADTCTHRGSDGQRGGGGCGGESKGEREREREVHTRGGLCDVLEELVKEEEGDADLAIEEGGEETLKEKEEGKKEMLEEGEELRADVVQSVKKKTSVLRRRSGRVGNER